MGSKMVRTEKTSLYKPYEYYSVLSKYWDQLYKNQVPYRQTFEFINSLREKENLSKEIADVACGTGLLLRYFEKAGYKIHGSDLSQAMLDQAKFKMPNIPLFQASYHEVTFPQPFPLIVSFFNSFAYCQGPETLSQVLRHLKSQLTPRGLIIFDLFVTDAPKEVFVVKGFSFDDGTHLSRTFLGYPENNTTYHSHFVFTIFDDHQPQTFMTESMRGIFSEQVVRKSIDSAGLNVYYVGTGPGSPEHAGSTTFIAQKRS
jgi:SAM-dependent methyltransferase